MSISGPWEQQNYKLKPAWLNDHLILQNGLKKIFHQLHRDEDDKTWKQDKTMINCNSEALEGAVETQLSSWSMDFITRVTNVCTEVSIIA